LEERRAARKQFQRETSVRLRQAHSNYPLFREIEDKFV
jgi:hypothetical protein